MTPSLPLERGPASLAAAALINDSGLLPSTARLSGEGWGVPPGLGSLRDPFTLTLDSEQAPNGCSRRGAGVYGSVVSVGHFNTTGSLRLKDNGDKRCELLRGRGLQTFAENGEGTWAKP